MPSVENQAPTASERVYEWVKTRILAGGYSGGDLLSEGAVAEDVGVSRTPVREAFIRLEHEGLMRLYPKRGALVVPVSAAEVADVLEARLVIERFAAQKVIAAGRGGAVATEMRKVLERQRQLSPKTKGAVLSELDRRFHGTLVEAAGNTIVTGLYASLRDRQLRIATGIFDRDPDARPTILAEHGSLCDHLEASDSTKACEVIEHHVHGTQSR